MANRALNGFNYIRNGLNISHLFFTDDSLFFSKATDSDCATIRRILDVYVTASGQAINFDKSIVFVSRSIPLREGIRLASIIGVWLVRCHKRYLGLPSLNCRNKRQLFNVIKDRVLAKIKGWRSKILSIGGKEIFLKAVVQAIPTYTIGLFRLPEGLLGELHKHCNRFWWELQRRARRCIGASGLECELIK
ncbi:hypothetical protein Dsin_022415 [Dipteronia sinensis]|uniref:Reverse transcriptase domain-containing protein n=1 Tax=Dipteronia sinensis TaxID=43782 RepID=A0AAE0DZR3_9ROSI|nr:hypothetical protein Dsin_022415 [Dipteronia sinensis]